MARCSKGQVFENVQSGWQACWSLWFKWFITLFHNSNGCCHHVVITVKAVVVVFILLDHMNLICHVRINVITQGSFSNWTWGFRQPPVQFCTANTLFPLSLSNYLFCSPVSSNHPHFSVCLFYTPLHSTSFLLSSCLVSSSVLCFPSPLPLSSPARLSHPE